MTMFHSFRTAMHKRSLYSRTRRELSRLPAGYAIEDLGIYPGDAKTIARQAVYG